MLKMTRNLFKMAIKKLTEHTLLENPARPAQAGLAGQPAWPAWAVFWNMVAGSWLNHPNPSYAWLPFSMIDQ